MTVRGWASPVTLIDYPWTVTCINCIAINCHPPGVACFYFQIGVEVDSRLSVCLLPGFLLSSSETAFQSPASHSRSSRSQSKRRARQCNRNNMSSLSGEEGDRSVGNMEKDSRGDGYSAKTSGTHKRHNNAHLDHFLLLAFSQLLLYSSLVRYRGRELNE